MVKFNPWHEVPIGAEVPDVVQAIVEISQGSSAKYELDKETGMLRLDRALFAAVYYPANYGFIPRTLGEDKDPLDIVVLSKLSIQPMCIVRAKVIGVMRMIDNNEADDKIIAVAADDVSVNYMNDIADLASYFNSELKHFFEEYKKLEQKTVLVENFQNKQVANKIILDSVDRYNTHYNHPQSTS